MDKHTHVRLAALHPSAEAIAAPDWRLHGRAHGRRWSACGLKTVDWRLHAVGIVRWKQRKIRLTADDGKALAQLVYGG